jgi:anhydro-N-acetylmuramic acid kinase
LQIGDPNTLAELTGITTVADFRRRDMAAGGQGAPIVPAFHREIFSSAETDRIVLNIGGMANITVLKKSGELSGFDTGPGNVLMDIWIQRHQGHPYDRDGCWAKSGTVNIELLETLLQEPYFGMPAPKSTGRELFNLSWLQSALGSMSGNLAFEDTQATLLAVTVYSIRDAIQSVLPGGEIIVCGGGANNAFLLESLAEVLPAFKVMRSSSLGVLEDSVEAVAFAWLAHQTLCQAPVDFTAFTGSSHPVIAGGVFRGQNTEGR